ncbi:MAG TPA: hypothetical protein VF660_11310 [Actinomycetota bacterium]|jgi:hypothetical protein
MNANEINADQLAQLLREAEAAHADYEKKLGRPDDDWPAWYARFIVDKLHGSKPEGGTSSSW